MSSNAKWAGYRASKLAEELASYAHHRDGVDLVRQAHENARTEALCALADAAQEIARCAMVIGTQLENIEMMLRSRSNRT